MFLFVFSAGSLISPNTTTKTTTIKKTIITWLKPKLSLLLKTKDTGNPTNQSELEVNKGSWRKAREIWCEWVTIGFGFDPVFDWLGDEVAQMMALNSFTSATVYLSFYCFVIVAAVIVLGLEPSGVDAGLFKAVLYFGFTELMRHASTI